MTLTSPDFWIALMQIIGVNIVLSGDNAVVIALAARGLPAQQQQRAVAWGSAAAVLMRIVLTIVAVELLRLPYLKLVGAALLLWIAVQLLLPEGEESGHEGAMATGMGAAIRTILVADLVMSVDNVIAVAAAAKGSTALLIIGLAISIPLVIFASRMLMVLMERYPVIITIGAGLLGWVGGEMAISDPIGRSWVDAQAPLLHWGAPLAGAIGVVLVGRWLAARKAAVMAEQASEAAPVAAAAGPPVHLKRVLLAVDGSDGAARAVHRLLALRSDLRQGGAIAVHLLNVQRPVTVDVARFVPGQTLDDYHHEQSEKALAPARTLLDAAGVAHQDHTRVGDPGLTVAQVARELNCDLIVMGARGLGTHTAALLGSVAQGAIEHAGMPVLVVK